MVMIEVMDAFHLASYLKLKLKKEERSHSRSFGERTVREMTRGGDAFFHSSHVLRNSVFSLGIDFCVLHPFPDFVSSFFFNVTPEQTNRRDDSFHFLPSSFFLSLVLLSHLLMRSSFFHSSTSF
jgi:hypothetical protein